MQLADYGGESWGLPGYEQSHWHFPWHRLGWEGRRPAEVWSPGTWLERIWCDNVLALDPCAYCGGEVETIDHITPTARGGENDWMNWTAACRSCNLFKKAKPLLLFLLDQRAAEAKARREPRPQCDAITARGERCRITAVWSVLTQEAEREVCGPHAYYLRDKPTTMAMERLP